ncbi:DNA repair and recombination RAD5C [Fusarium subglutinans]|uniref:DNA repair and recombination RAD5C n=1 Tax=Gibberella subglutinans TaxID=42677 RepID=A0A8H5PC11_GIBSU|nr:DNA repair and recombination RAD5C [Fusarium subglutinans]KAF5593767.1 DNA repair and recombination RAD5C [Fusarium subglutinans]
MRAGSKLPIELNIYGRREDAESIGRTLSKMGTYLQFPRCGLEGVEYYNPHFFRMEGYPEQASIETLLLCPPQVTEARNRASDQEPEVTDSDAVDEILGSLSYRNLRDGIQVDGRIKSVLYPYQKEAIDFILKRETGDIPSELSLWKYNSTDADEPFYQHVFSGAKRPNQEEAEGGILADDMGLGKSLVILSTIAGSLDRANAFVESSQRSAATLIVVSSAHSNVKFPDVTYQPPVELTYKSGILIPVACLVTDTLVHNDITRNRRTNQFKAVAALSAKHRWCLTGTPIQNSMEDLGALVSFLRVPVLENAPTFYKFITGPATSSASRDRFKNLRTLLETICLRRTRDILPLKHPVTYVREVLLTNSERQEYNNLVHEGKTQLDMITSGHSKRKVSSVVLQSILKLRLFCNNGRSIDNQQFEITGLPSDPDEALTYLQQHERNICAICSVTIYSIDSSDKTDGGRFIFSCCHLFCRTCMPQYRKRKSPCPACHQEGEPELPGAGPTQDGQASSGTSGQTGSGFSKDDYPSKLLRLLDDIRQHNTEKSIVFSCWKKTLFLVSALLSHHSIRHGIIHGSRTLTERTKALKEFQSKTGPTILLMTLGTGAVGLNLAVASRIYLLEPQWNPSIEEQAIGRALRLGQESQVVVVRYITAKTVEQADVVFRQRRKLQLVGGGFGKGKNAASETLVESLLHVFDDDGAST